MKPILYLPFWYFKTKFLGKKCPLQTVLFITDKCNLECRHCCVYQKDTIHTKSYETIREELLSSFKKGARFVDFEGGEPTLWRDGEKTLNDLHVLAKEIGFFTTTITTNAQQPFDDSNADSIWVSLDGIHEYHDAIRGKGAFENLERNLQNNYHPAISANMTVNNLNYKSLDQTIEWVKNHPHLQSISINFHTPFPGTESLALDREIKNAMIDKVIDYKRRKYPILNSVSGLLYMKGEVSNQYCWISNFIYPDGTQRTECEGKTLKLCDKCGFCMAGEMKAVMNLKPDTIIAALKLRMKS